MSFQRILVVADNETVRAELTECLVGMSIELLQAESTMDGEALHHWKPDMVVIDVGTPGYDGDIAWRFRSALDQVFPNEPPIVAVTRMEPGEAEDRANRLDAFELVPWQSRQRLPEVLRSWRPRTVAA